LLDSLLGIRVQDAFQAFRVQKQTSQHGDFFDITLNDFFRIAAYQLNFCSIVEEYNSIEGRIHRMFSI